MLPELLVSCVVCGRLHAQSFRQLESVTNPRCGGCVRPVATPPLPSPPR